MSVLRRPVDHALKQTTFWPHYTQIAKPLDLVAYSYPCRLWLTATVELTGCLLSQVHRAPQTKGRSVTPQHDIRNPRLNMRIKKTWHRTHIPPFFAVLWLT
jgi:hypothetical protein